MNAPTSLATVPAVPTVRLRPGAALLRASSGWIVRTPEHDHFTLHLDDARAVRLADHLTGPAHAVPADDPDLGPVLAALTEAGVVRTAPTGGIAVIDPHDTDLARAVTAALGALHDPISPAVRIVLDRPSGTDADADGSDLPTVHCWFDPDAAWITPPGVSPRDVELRMRAALAHLRRPDPATTPVAGFPHLQGVDRSAGSEAVVTALIAAQTAALAARVVDGNVVGRASRCALRVDLHRLAVTDHPVLPVPADPA